MPVMPHDISVDYSRLKSLPAFPRDRLVLVETVEPAPLSF